MWCRFVSSCLKHMAERRLPPRSVWVCCWVKDIYGRSEEGFLSLREVRLGMLLDYRVTLGRVCCSDVVIFA